MTDSNDALAGAVETAEASTVRVEAGRCGRQTGFAFAADLVCTSERALRGSEELRVGDHTGRAYETELLGRDSALDLAVLRLKDASLPTLAVADHASLRVGQLTLALGRPGANIRASLRIVGLLGGEQQTPGGARLHRYVESDRGLPDGFEGGPLIDARGALIGMNSSSVWRGADLTVPHATLAASVAEIAAHGRRRRGYLGVACQPLRLPSALREQLDQRSGALVVDLDDGGPAHAAGIAFGDVIVRVDAQKITGPRELVSALRDQHATQVEVGFLRSGQLQRVQLTPKERS
jgi:S1-C subfamily serine protease